MVMPLFSVLGGLVVFAWSRRLYGDLGRAAEPLPLGLLPEHPGALPADHDRRRLDGAGRGGDLRVLALSCASPSWRRAMAAGVMLGLAELTKFSMLLLYAVWPFLWLVRLILADAADPACPPRCDGRSLTAR